MMPNYQNSYLNCNSQDDMSENNFNQWSVNSTPMKYINPLSYLNNIYSSVSF